LYHRKWRENERGKNRDGKIVMVKLIIQKKKLKNKNKNKKTHQVQEQENFQSFGKSSEIIPRHLILGLACKQEL
jgi:D-lyxose ketol-isomerase